MLDTEQISVPEIKSWMPYGDLCKAALKLEGEAAHAYFEDLVRHYMAEKRLNHRAAFHAVMEGIAAQAAFCNEETQARVKRVYGGNGYKGSPKKPSAGTSIQNKNTVITLQDGEALLSPVAQRRLARRRADTHAFLASRQPENAPQLP